MIACLPSLRAEPGDADGPRSRHDFALDLRPVIIAGQGFELVERVSDELREVLLVGFVDPALERDLDDSHPCLRGQARGRAVTPRRRNVSASAADNAASLISSRS